MKTKPLLDLDSCTVRFGGLTALSHLSFSIHEHDLVGLIGPNGAGKTTVFNIITGIYKPSEGRVHLDGRCINGVPPHRISRCGIARTFQNIRLFRSLSVHDNVRAAFNNRIHHGIAHAFWRGPGFTREEEGVTREVRELLRIFQLDRLRDAPCPSLSYGDQRRLEIVRALATQPKLLLLDEPAAGMNPQEKIELMELIRFIKERFNIAVLLVEHDMNVVMGICQRIIVLDHGLKIAEGSPGEIRHNPTVIEAYLGRSTT